MGRRRRRAEAPKPRSGKPPPEQLDSLAAPNHNPRLALWPEDYAGLSFQPERLYALMLLMASEQGGGSPTGVLFVDERYNLRHWADRPACPPTWMDPEVFVRQLLQDGACAKIAADYAVKKSASGYRRMRAEIARVFSESYAPYLEAKFEQALPVLAQWVTAYLTTKEQDVKTPVRKKTRPGRVKLVLPGADRGPAAAGRRTRRTPDTRE